MGLYKIIMEKELEQLKRSHDQDLVKLRQKIALDGKEAAKRQKLEIRQEQRNLKERLRASSYSSEQEREALKEVSVIVKNFRMVSECFSVKF